MKHLIKLVELVAAVILSALLFPIGLVYNIIIGFNKLPKFICLFIIEVYQLTFDSFEKVAIIIDRLGNVILGNMFTNLFIYKQFRKIIHFNQSEVTISAAFGHAFKHGFLNKKGIWFVNLLDKTFGQDHCINAYEFDLLKQTFNNKTGIS